MGYPIDTPYRGFIIRQYDPQYTKNAFRGFYAPVAADESNYVTLYCATLDEAKLLIDDRIRSASDDT